MNWEEFKNEKIAARVEVNDAEAFMAEAVANGCRLASGVSQSRYVDAISDRRGPVYLSLHWNANSYLMWGDEERDVKLSGLTMVDYIPGLSDSFCPEDFCGLLQGGVLT